jgi:hypothetical protein
MWGSSPDPSAKRKGSPKAATGGLGFNAISAPQGSNIPRDLTVGVEFVTVLVKGLKLSGLAPVEAVEGILFKS